MSDTTRRLPHFLEAILLAAAFALAYTQSPLYFSNQNQYFLHGLARGGVGHLSHDWLAQTRDPTPLFSMLVAVGYRDLGPICFQVVYYLMLMGYFLSVRWLIAALPSVPDSRSFRLAFAAIFTASHCAILRLVSVWLTGVDYPWNLQAGVAGQYLVGAGLQPSAFGILLMTSTAAFAHRRPTLAAFLAAAPCAFHSTYLLPAGLLVFGYLVYTFWRVPRPGPLALRMVLLSFAIVTPVCAYTLFTFGPSNAEVFQESQRILAEVRIPHHCAIDRWFDWVALGQLVWAAVGLLLLRRTALFFPLLIAAGLAVLLSIIQYETRSPTLSLMFPWRISALLVPLATAVIAARIVGLLPPLRWVSYVSSAVLLALALAGAWVMATHQGYRSGDDEEPLYDFIRNHASADDVYLIPTRIPPVGKGRGSISTSFTPPPRPAPGSNLIPVDLQRFRLLTGFPIFIDFKAVPYADVEVLDWLRRVKQCEAWYAGNWSRVGLTAELRAEGITCVVAPAGRPIIAEGFDEVHADSAYRVYRIR